MSKSELCLGTGLAFRELIVGVVTMTDVSLGLGQRSRPGFKMWATTGQGGGEGQESLAPVAGGRGTEEGHPKAHMCWQDAVDRHEAMATRMASSRTGLAAGARSGPSRIYPEL